jgi:cytoskeletal protein CcmA (bactofilin family)
LNGKAKLTLAVALGIVALVAVNLYLGMSYPLPPVVEEEIVALGVTHFSGLEVTGSEADEFVVNQTSTGDIAEFRDSGSVVLRIFDGGLITTSSSISVGGRITATSWISAFNDLSVSGALDVAGNASSATGAFTVSDDLSVSGAVTLASSLSLAGNASSATGAFTVSDDLSVSGAVTLASSLSLADNTSVYVAGGSEYTVTSAGIDVGSNALTLTDATLAVVDTNGQLEIAIKGSDAVTLTSTGLDIGSKALTVTTGSILMEGNQLDLDNDEDTSITADTDDQIDIEISAADEYSATATNWYFDGNRVDFNTLQTTSLESVDTNGQLEFEIGAEIAYTMTTTGLDLGANALTMTGVTFSGPMKYGMASDVLSGTSIAHGLGTVPTMIIMQPITSHLTGPVFSWGVVATSTSAFIVAITPTVTSMDFYWIVGR